jgi:hypothetical protein
MVRIIVADKKHDCNHLLGKFVDASNYDYLVALEGNITDDAVDVYMPAICDLSTQADCTSTCNECDKGSNEKRIAFKFRRNFFSQEEHDDAYEGLKDAAGLTDNRGTAAGNIESHIQIATEDETEMESLNRMVTAQQQAVLKLLLSIPEDTYLNSFDLNVELDKILQTEYKQDFDRFVAWLKYTLPEDFSFDNWLQETRKLPFQEIKKAAQLLQDKHISKSSYAVKVSSGVAGWYDRYPRIPYGRETSYTRDNFDKFTRSFPFLQSLNKGFKELLPWRWSNQKAASDKIDPKFLVPDTVFTTITVNKNFKTACHFDAGDLQEGLSNLLVLSKNDNYEGAYLVFPEYRIAVSVRPRDLLLVNNHEVLHGNTKIIKNEEDAERISIIVYFRENMLQLGEYDYEQYRMQFVESRKTNKEHPLWVERWNGISAGMWSDSINKSGEYSESQEWYEFLMQHPKGNEWVNKYHPHMKEYFEGNSLEDFM